MKKFSLLLSLSTLLFVAGNSYSQEDCINGLFEYFGPTNTEELSSLLMTSDDPAIVNLDDSTKSSLIAHMHFADGLPKGMNGTDENIQNLYNSNAEEVFTAIFGEPTIVHSHDAGPIVQDISRTELINNYPNYTTMMNWCYNCALWVTPHPDGSATWCCDVGGNGCGDQIARVNGVYYKVSDASGCTLVCVSSIPTLTEWGMIIFVVLLGGWMTFVVVRRWRRSHTMAA